MRIGTPKYLGQRDSSACVNSSAPLIDSQPLKIQLPIDLFLVLII